MDGLIYLPPVAAAYYSEYGFDEMINRPANTTGQMNNSNNPPVQHEWGQAFIINAVHSFAPTDYLSVKLVIGPVSITTAMTSVGGHHQHPTSRIMVDTDPNFPESVLEAMTSLAGRPLCQIIEGLPSWLETALEDEIIKNVSRMSGRLQFTTEPRTIGHATQLRVRCNGMTHENLDPIALVDHITPRHSDSEMSYA